MMSVTEKIKSPSPVFNATSILVADVERMLTDCDVGDRFFEFEKVT